MKNRGEDAEGLMKIFRWSLYVAVVGIGLAGCGANSSIILPPDWNVADALSVGPSRPESAAALQALPASAGFIGGLQRQPDCSLTYRDFAYAVHSNGASLAPHSQIPHYETTLHDNAALNTTADRFISGCADNDSGASSRSFLFLGQDNRGQTLVAAPGGSGVVTAGVKSDGTYTEPLTLSTHGKPVSLLSGDLNRDGNLDVVSINSNGLQSSVTIFLQKGDGTFEGGEDYALPGANARYGVLDDLNGDGIPDLLVSSDKPAFAFSIYIGNGDGTLQPPHTFIPEGANLDSNSAFITADVNGDGKQDIVTAQGQIFLGMGDGVSYSEESQPAFQADYTAANHVSPAIVAADFNRDGHMDLATNDGATIRIYSGNGGGTFTAGPTYPAIANSGSLLATDLDGDGNIDLWSGYGGHGIYSGDAYLPDAALALMGKGDGTFTGTAGLPSALAVESAAMVHAIPDTTSTLTISSPVPNTITVAAGQTSAPFVVVLGTNTAQSVTLACSGLPALSTCIFPQTPFFLSGSVNSVPVNIEIATTANGAAYLPLRIPQPRYWIVAECGCVAGLLLTFMFLPRTTGRKIKWVISACLLAMMSSGFVGCSSKSSLPSSGGTPPGTYSVTVTGLGQSGVVVSSPNTLTLKVTQ